MSKPKRVIDPEMVITITGAQGIGKSTVGAAIAELLASHGIAATIDGVPGHVMSDVEKQFTDLPNFTVRVVTRPS